MSSVMQSTFMNQRSFGSKTLDVVGTASGQNSSSTAVNFTYPSDTQEGDLVVGFFMISGNASSTFRDQGGWTRGPNNLYSNVTIYHQIAHSGTAGSTGSFYDPASERTRRTAIIIVLRNGQFTSNSNTATAKNQSPFTTPALTNATDNSTLLYIVGSEDPNQTYTVSGMTLQLAPNANVSYNMKLLIQQDMASGSTGNKIATYSSGGGTWLAMCNVQNKLL